MIAIVAATTKLLNVIRLDILGFILHSNYLMSAQTKMLRFHSTNKTYTLGYRTSRLNRGQMPTPKRCFFLTMRSSITKGCWLGAPGTTTGDDMVFSTIEEPESPDWPVLTTIVRAGAVPPAKYSLV